VEVVRSPRNESALSGSANERGAASAQPTIGQKNNTRFVIAKEVFRLRQSTEERWRDAASNHLTMDVTDEHGWELVFKSSGVSWIATVGSASFAMTRMVHLPSSPNGSAFHGNAQVDRW
jgi:hypothetical protein